MGWWVTPFQYGDRVVVVHGFYKGITGFVKRRRLLGRLVIQATVLTKDGRMIESDIQVRPWRLAKVAS